MSEDILDAETRLAVRNETEKVLSKLATVFGAANIAVLVGGLWFMWSSITDQTAGMASSGRHNILEELRSDRAELDAAVRTANQLIGKLEKSQIDMGKIEGEIASLQSNLSKLADREAITNAAAFLDAWKGAPDLVKLTERVSKVEDLTDSPPDIVQFNTSCAVPRVVAGRTEPNRTGWEKYKDSNTGIFVSVDTSIAEFQEPPVYFTSLGGTGGHWFTTGTSSIYSPEKDGFKLYVRWADQDYTHPKALKDYAADAKWHVNWVAIGC